MMDQVNFRNPIKTKLNCLLFGNDPAIGEAYINGEFVCDDLVSFLVESLRNKRGSTIRLVPYIRRLSHKVVDHYNIPVWFWKLLLGETMFYTCGNFEVNDSLKDAQKFKALRHKALLDLSNANSLLDLGCGWGSFLRYMQLFHPDVEYIGVSNSIEQIKYCESEYANIDFICNDWANYKPNIKHDRITAQGFLEHVGIKNIPKLFKHIYDITTDDMIGTLQFISKDVPMSVFFDKYIFPGAQPPSLNYVIRQLNKAGFKVDKEMYVLTKDYELTCLAWLKNLQGNKDEITQKMGIKFYRMFEFYLSAGVAIFRTQQSQLVQLRYTKRIREV